LKALALQIGSEVSLRELGQLLGISPQTVDKYVWLLEQCFIIFTLRSLSRNMRNELKRSVKVYFWDVGVRNALLQNFLPFDQRDDVCNLWENFCISERMKINNQNGYQSKNMYFWRTVSQQEIDLVEEANGILTAYEFKWNSQKKPKFPETFKQAYPNAEFNIINESNWLDLTV